MVPDTLGLQAKGSFGGNSSGDFMNRFKRNKPLTISKISGFDSIDKGDRLESFPTHYPEWELINDTFPHDFIAKPLG
jgi:hypothetical protein